MLRSAKSLRAYHLRATDGNIGRVSDFLFGGEGWVIRYVVADTSDWLPGRKILLIPDVLGPPSTEGEILPVSLSREHVENSPDIDASLRSMREVAGYSIHAADGHIGHVEDFIIDDEEWAVRYIVVDTRNWLPGRKVLISPEWVRRIDWRSNEVWLDHSRDEIRKSPHYDPNQPVNRQYELRLYDYYGRRKYWV